MGSVENHAPHPPGYSAVHTQVTEPLLESCSLTPQGSVLPFKSQHKCYFLRENFSAQFNGSHSTPSVITSALFIADITTCIYCLLRAET